MGDWWEHGYSETQHYQHADDCIRCPVSGRAVAILFVSEEIRLGHSKK